MFIELLYDHIYVKAMLNSSIFKGKYTMKILTLILFIAIHNIVLAQFPTSQEIKNKKIKKVTIYHEGKTKEENSYRELYYDENGYDTAFYSAGERWRHKLIEYDVKKRPIKITEFFIYEEGRPTEVTNFTYNLDGSYISEMIDPESGLKHISQYDKYEKQISETTAWGTKSTFEYNKKGMLLRESIFGKDGQAAYAWEYTYNDKDKLIARIFKGDNSVKSTLEYDEKGLLAKEIETITYTDKSVRTTIDKYVFSY